MSTNQLFFAVGGLVLTLFGVMITLFGMAMAYFKHYLDAKFEPVNGQLKMLIDYMMLHEGKIARLEERTK